MSPASAQRVRSLETASLLDWLAGVFMAPPSAGTITSYRQDIGAALFEMLAEYPECAAGVRQMQAVSECGDEAGAVARRLDIEFTRLFGGAGGAHAVSPYESAYVGDTGRLYQKPAGDMALSLRQFNLSVSAAFREPPDHLSIELAMLARLTRQGTAVDAIAALLDDHLLGWVPAFAAECRDADSTGFYAGAASALAEFLAMQRNALRTPHIITPITGVTPCPSI